MKKIIAATLLTLATSSTFAFEKIVITDENFRQMEETNPHAWQLTLSNNYFEVVENHTTSHIKVNVTNRQQTLVQIEDAIHLLCHGQDFIVKPGHTAPCRLLPNETVQWKVNTEDFKTGPKGIYTISGVRGNFSQMAV